MVRQQIFKAIRFWGPIMALLYGAAFAVATYWPFALTASSNPPSIREGSVSHPRGSGRTRYFVGGGLHGGK